MSNAQVTSPQEVLSGSGEAPWRFEQGLKDPAVEEPIDLHWHRRLGFALIRPLQYSTVPITPTQITMASLVIGLVASWFYWQAATYGAGAYVMGTLLLLLSIALDCADGMYARFKRMSSEFGMLLDGLVDFFVGFGMWLGLSHSAAAALPAHWAVWPSLMLLFFAIIAHIAYYDHFKNIFVRLSMPKGARPSKTRPVPTSLVPRIAEFFYEHWYGRMSALICGSDVEDLEHVEPADARRELGRAMKMTTWLGTGLHFFVMYVAALAMVVVPHATFVIAQVVITFGLSVWMLFTVLEQRRAARVLRALKVAQ